MLDHLEARMAPARVLVVDDDYMVRSTLCEILASHDFEVTDAADVSEALRHITTQKFNALVTDLHMPGAGDGLTVVSAMRHANPDAVTLLLSAFPEMSAAANAILMQTDEILVKPLKVPDLIETLRRRIAKGQPHKRKVETLGTILTRTTDEVVEAWYAQVEKEDALTNIHMSREERCRHLPQLCRDLARRLQSFQPLGTKELESEAAYCHGLDRRRQGYKASMMVAESRILQIAIFHILQDNLGTIDFSVLLLGVMTIADEVNSQLSQAIRSYTAEAEEDGMPT